MKQKIELLDLSKAQDLINLTEKISETNKTIEHLKVNIKSLKGDTIKNMNYFELNDLEKQLLTLMIKTKKAISEYDMKIIKEHNIIMIDDVCIICKMNKIDIIILPCSHVLYCIACISNIKFCGECFKEVESYDKVYINN